MKRDAIYISWKGKKENSKTLAGSVTTFQANILME